MTSDKTGPDPETEEPGCVPRQHVPQPRLFAWLRAWRDVLRDPHKIIPSIELPPEGEPLPEELDLRCPECHYSLTGLRIWRCPECGQPFHPRRAHTLEMLRRPEYFLRYRLGAAEIRSAFLALLLFVAGVILVIAGGPIALQHGTVIFLSFLGVWIVPNIIMARTQGGWPWSHFLLFLSVLWLIVAALLLTVVTWM